MKTLAWQLLPAICMAGSSFCAAAELLSEDFEASGNLPAGWIEFDPGNRGAPSISVGHNGSGGGAGNSLQYHSTVNAPNALAGGFMKAPVQMVTHQPFTLKFDLKIEARTNSSFDDALIVFGDLSDPYGTDGTAVNRYMMAIFNEASSSNELFLVNEGSRGSSLMNFSGGSGLAVGVWFKVEIDWTPASGTSGTFSLKVVNASTGMVRVSTTSPVVDFGPLAEFGFGSYNDIGFFDNIALNGVAPANNVNAADDAHTLGIGGAIRFNPLGNDVAGIGVIDPASLEILTPPQHGTAQIDPLKGEIIYQHIGTVAGTDTLRYRVSNSVGGGGEADANLTISADLRLPNQTLTLDADGPPPAGVLQLVDAFPGLTFDGTVAMASVPGSPEKLIVASAHGPSTGSGSKVWMIPNTGAVNPVKKEIFGVDSLCPVPFVRGRAIYSAVCHPDFATNGRIIVCYQGKPDGFPIPVNQIPNLSVNGNPDSTITCTLRISAFTITPAQLDVLLNSSDSALLAQTRAAIVATELRYLNLAEQHLFHSINDCHFGSDGYLYVSFGDEGDQSEPYRNAQYITKDQYSSIIRIDVDRRAKNVEPNPHYAILVNPQTGQANFKIPADNPYVGASVSFNGTTYTPAHPDFGKIRTEIWATGLRNPFKFHLESVDGVVEAWVGDVGMDAREEVSRLRKGDNAGWSYWEGTRATGFSHAIQPEHHQEPEWEYAHSSGNNCVIGGVFYRGSSYNAPLNGKYLFGDHGSGRIWRLDPAVSGAEKVTDLGVGTVGQVVDFHVDPLTDQVLIAQYQSGKKILRLKEAPPVGGTFPRWLSETGAFADLATLTPNPGVVAYEPNLKFWSDHADKARWFAIKNTTDTMGYSRNGNWSFPEGMIFIKHFDMEMNRDQPGTAVKRLETRFLVRTAGGSYGVSYRWNEAGTDASLVDVSGDAFDLEIQTGGASAIQRWHIPSRGDCLTCHNPTAGHALSLSTPQLNHEGELGGQTGNFLRLLADAGYLEDFTDDPAALYRFHRPSDESANLEDRVRSYLAVNCSYCHQPNSGVVESWDARGHLSIDEMRLLHGMPLSETYHEPDDRLILPGDTLNSLLWNRIQARNALGNGKFNGYSQMPPIATGVVDEEGVALLTRWINEHANAAPEFAAGSSQSSLARTSDLGEEVSGPVAQDLDVRNGEADQDRLRYEITGGNDFGVFRIDPETGRITVNGLLGFGGPEDHSLEITVSDDFLPNPRQSSRFLTIGLTGPDHADENENGIPDSWESVFSGFSETGAASDPDGDGVKNFFEFLTGGDPTSPAFAAHSQVGIDASDASGIELEWRARNGVLMGTHYHLFHATSLAGPWQRLDEGLYEPMPLQPDGQGFSKWRVRVQADGPRGFYRFSNQSGTAD